MKVELKHNAEGEPRIQIKLSRKQAMWLENAAHGGWRTTEPNSKEEKFFEALLDGLRSAVASAST